MLFEVLDERGDIAFDPVQRFFDVVDLCTVRANPSVEISAHSGVVDRDRLLFTEREYMDRDLIGNGEIPQVAFWDDVGLLDGGHAVSSLGER